MCLCWLCWRKHRQFSEQPTCSRTNNFTVIETDSVTRIVISISAISEWYTVKSDGSLGDQVVNCIYFETFQDFEMCRGMPQNLDKFQGKPRKYTYYVVCNLVLGPRLPSLFSQCTRMLCDNFLPVGQRPGGCVTNSYTV